MNKNEFIQSRKAYAASVLAGLKTAIPSDAEKIALTRTRTTEETMDFPITAPESLMNRIKEHLRNQGISYQSVTAENQLLIIYPSKLSRRPVTTLTKDFFKKQCRIIENLLKGKGIINARGGRNGKRPGGSYTFARVETMMKNKQLQIDIPNKTPTTFGQVLNPLKAYYAKDATVEIIDSNYSIYISYKTGAGEISNDHSVPAATESDIIKNMAVEESAVKSALIRSMLLNLAGLEHEIILNSFSTYLQVFTQILADEKISLVRMEENNGVPSFIGITAEQLEEMLKKALSEFEQKK